MTLSIGTPKTGFLTAGVTGDDTTMYAAEFPAFIKYLNVVNRDVVNRVVTIYLMPSDGSPAVLLVPKAGITATGFILKPGRQELVIEKGETLTLGVGDLIFGFADAPGVVSFVVGHVRKTA